MQFTRYGLLTLIRLDPPASLIFRPNLASNVGTLRSSSFCQAEDGIRSHCVTGVQTCALPIYGKFEFEINMSTGAWQTLVNDTPTASVTASEIGRASSRERV